MKLKIMPRPAGRVRRACRVRSGHQRGRARPGGGVHRAPAVLSRIDQLGRHGQPGRPRARAPGDLGPVPDGGEGRLDRSVLPRPARRSTIGPRRTSPLVRGAGSSEFPNVNGYGHGDASRSRPVAANADPQWAVQKILRRYGTLGSAVLVHSSSWRAEDESVILCYFAVIDCPDISGHWPATHPPTNPPTHPPHQPPDMWGRRSPTPPTSRPCRAVPMSSCTRSGTWPTSPAPTRRRRRSGPRGSGTWIPGSQRLPVSAAEWQTPSATSPRGSPLRHAAAHQPGHHGADRPAPHQVPAS